LAALDLGWFAVNNPPGCQVFAAIEEKAVQASKSVICSLIFTKIVQISKKINNFLRLDILTDVYAQN
jgi:hypothetical protein